MPKTKLGKWSIWLIVAFGISILIFNAGAVLSGILGIGGDDSLFDLGNLFLTIPIILAAITGIASLITGLISVIFLKERASLIYVSIVVGAIVLIFTLGEILSPH